MLEFNTQSFVNKSNVNETIGCFNTFHLALGTLVSDHKSKFWLTDVDEA
jgi:hypothetical protein